MHIYTEYTIFIYKLQFKRNNGQSLSRKLSIHTIFYIRIMCMHNAFWIVIEKNLLGSKNNGVPLIFLLLLLFIKKMSSCIQTLSSVHRTFSAIPFYHVSEWIQFQKQLKAYEEKSEIKQWITNKETLLLLLYCHSVGKIYIISLAAIFNPSFSS